MSLQPLLGIEIDGYAYHHKSKHKHKNKKEDMKVFAHYMGNEKDWNLSEDGLHEEGFRTRTVV